jgi:hypothetical protein
MVRSPFLISLPLLRQRWDIEGIRAKKYHAIKFMISKKIVTPVKTGVHSIYKSLKRMDSGACPGLDPGFAGMTKNHLFRVFTNSSKLMTENLPIKERQHRTGQSEGIEQPIDHDPKDANCNEEDLDERVYPSFSWPMNPGLKKIIINYALHFWVIFYRLWTGFHARVGIFRPLMPLIIFLDHVTFFS